MNEINKNLNDSNKQFIDIDINDEDDDDISTEGQQVNNTTTTTTAATPTTSSTSSTNGTTNNNSNENIKQKKFRFSLKLNRNNQQEPLNQSKKSTSSSSSSSVADLKQLLTATTISKIENSDTQTTTTRVDHATRLRRNAEFDHEIDDEELDDYDEDEVDVDDDEDDDDDDDEDDLFDKTNLNQTTCDDSFTTNRRTSNASQRAYLYTSTPTIHTNTFFDNYKQMYLDSNNNNTTTISSNNNNNNSSTTSKSNNSTANSCCNISLNNYPPSPSLYKNQQLNGKLSRHDSCSIVDGLLCQIYDRYNCINNLNKDSSYFDSDIHTEDFSMSSSRFSDSADFDYKYAQFKHKKHNLKLKNNNELSELINEMSTKINQMSTKLIRYLKCKDKLTSKLNRNCDIVTAILQATSLKRRIDTQMKFTINPLPGDTGFIQWKEAVKALARLPNGIPTEFRKNIWLNLANKYIEEINLDWEKTIRFVFNDRSNPDDDELGVQIVKDLHRTGCSTFSGEDSEHDRALLKRVLLAYARYNKNVGYCQGFNIIAALLLEMVDKKEEDAFLLMIYLIDSILPDGYFTNSMHTLAIDMAVFRELLKQKLPKLYEHLNQLQYGTTDNNGTKSSHKKKKQQQQQQSMSINCPNYEPPLTNVFTMQWFLTVFATCLPKTHVLRVWDCIMIESSTEILFRTALSIWDSLTPYVMKATSADHFYSLMSTLTTKLLDENLIDEKEIVNKIYSFGPLPLTDLKELREKYTFNITPFQLCLKQKQQHQQQQSPNSQQSQQQTTNVESLMTTKSSAEPNNRNTVPSQLSSSKPDNEDIDKLLSCFALLVPHGIKTRPELLYHNNNSSSIQVTPSSSATAAHNSPLDISQITPGAYSYIPQMHHPKPFGEHLTLDISELKKQYNKLKQRQQQAHVILQAANARHRLKASSKSVLPTIDDDETENENTIFENEETSNGKSSVPTSPVSPTSYQIELTSPMCNHLLIKPHDSHKNILKQPVSLSYSTPTLMVHVKSNLTGNSSNNNNQTNPQSPKFDNCETPKTPLSATANNLECSSRSSSSSESQESSTPTCELTIAELAALYNQNTETPISSISPSPISPNQQQQQQQQEKQTTIKATPKLQKSAQVINHQSQRQTNNILSPKLPTPNKVFNPFPMRQSINSNVAKNGIRLGLYK